MIESREPQLKPRQKEAVLNAIPFNRYKVLFLASVPFGCYFLYWGQLEGFEIIINVAVEMGIWGF